MEKSWFTDRIGKTVIRVNTYDNSETEFEVTEKNVGYLWLYTLKGYTYRDVKGEDDWLSSLPTPKPRLVVHTGPPKSTCISCEG